MFRKDRPAPARAMSMLMVSRESVTRIEPPLAQVAAAMTASTSVTTQTFCSA